MVFACQQRWCFKASAENKTSPGIWQQIVEKLESKAAAARFVCDVVWITRRRVLERQRTFIFVSLRQNHKGRKHLCARARLRKCARAGLQAAIFTLKTISLLLSSSLSPSPLRHGWASFCHHAVLAVPLYSSPLDGLIISILLRSAQGCWGWSGEVKRPLRAVVKSIWLKSRALLAARPVPKTRSPFFFSFF